MDIKIFFDIFIICLLVPAIIYMIVLNQRIKTLRSQKDDFLKLIAVFNDVTAKAESSLSKIKSIGETSGKNLKELVDQAATLREDLAFINDRATMNIENLEKLIRKAKLEEDNNRVSNNNVSTYGEIDNNHGNSKPSFIRKSPLTMLKKQPSSNNNYSSTEDDDAIMEQAIRMAKNEASNYEKNNTEEDGNFRLDDEHTEIERELIRNVFMNINKKEE